MTVGNNISELLYVDISLFCPVSGLPKPEVTWKKDGKVLIPGDTYTIDSNGTLKFNANTLDADGLYTCIAENVAGKDVLSSVINLQGRAENRMYSK